MADQPSRPSRSLHLEYRFDRLLPHTLVQAYELLVPDRRWSMARAPGQQPVSSQEVLN